MLVLLRFTAVVVGVVLLCQITADLLDGHITYGLRDTDDIFTERVTTKTIPEALSIWLAFSALFVGLIIFGVAPRWFVEKPWLWKVLVAVIFVGYTLGSLLR
jgi:hypothetical protein